MRLIWYNLLLLSPCCILCHFHLTSMSLIIFFLKSCSKALHHRSQNSRTVVIHMPSLQLNTGATFSRNLSYNILLGRFITKYCQMNKKFQITVGSNPLYICFSRSWCLLGILAQTKTTHGIKELHVQKCSEQRTTSKTIFMAVWLRKMGRKVEFVPGKWFRLMFLS